MTGLSLSAFLIGLASAAHCFGMCGGLVVAAGFNSTRKSYLLLYNLGRITTYVFLGAIFGFSSAQLPDSALPILKTISMILLLLTSMHFLGISAAVTSIEKIGIPIWRSIQPITSALLPISSEWAAFALGLLWGLIPCGLVYTALAFAISLADTRESMFAMLAFGLGTLPAMISVGLAANVIRPILSNPMVKLSLGIILLVTALALGYSTFF